MTDDRDHAHGKMSALLPMASSGAAGHKPTAGFRVLVRASVYIQAARFPDGSATAERIIIF